MDEARGSQGAARLRLQMCTRKMSETARERLNKLVGSHAKATDEEKRMIEAWRSKSLYHTALGGIFGFAVMRLPPWPASRFWSVIMGCTTGLIVGSWSMVNQAPGIVVQMIHQEQSSSLVDDAICPSLAELKPCLDEPQCAAALKSATATAFNAGKNNPIDISLLLQRCRQRASAWQQAQDQQLQHNSLAPGNNFSTADDPPLNEWGFPEQPSDNAKDDE